MPIYEYACLSCGKRFSWLTGVVADAGRPACPKCHGRRLRRVMSRFATVRADEALDDLDDEPGSNFDDEMDAALDDDAGDDED